MIRSMTISNYRSLGEDVHISFEPLTVFVGPNGSGKSNVVDAARFLADAMHMGLSGAITHRHGMGAVRRWSGGHPHNVVITVHADLQRGGRGTYALEIRGASQEEYRIKSEEAVVTTAAGTHRFKVEAGKWIGPTGLRPQVDEQTLALPAVGGDDRFQPLFRELQSISVYAIFPDNLREPQKYSPVKPMDRHGSAWASILKDQPVDTWKPELLAALGKLTGDVEDIKVEAVASYLVVRFKHRSTSRRNPKWFDAAQQSDGTLRVAGILSALLQEPAVPVLVIEEPELTVHPGAIPLIYDFLQQGCGRGQVIVTTHSPELLDRIPPEAVRVVTRVDGATQVAPMDGDQRDRVRAGLLTLGEALRTEGLRPQLPLPFTDAADDSRSPLARGDA